MGKTLAAQEAREIRFVEPRVRLVAYTKDPYQLAVASARTCYAADFEFVGRITPKGERSRTTLLGALPHLEAELAEIGRLDIPHDQRIIRVEALLLQLPTDDLRAALQEFANQARIRAEGNAALAHSIYEAGHHTPFQHPTFVFALEDVSRDVVESFFHNHIFYNSEQQSQRYVEMKRADVHAPASVRNDPVALGIYRDGVRHAWEAYHALRERLVAPNHRVMAAIGKVKGQSDKESLKEAEKKAQEMARYVIPIAAATQLYHTVSGIVLLRYLRMCEASSAPAEARAVVEAMAAEVRKIDAAFMDQAQESPRARAQHAEWALAGDAPLPPLDAKARSVLVHHTPDASRLVVDAVREVTGSTLPAKELLARVLDPGRNAVWNDTLNTWDHSPVLRSLRHVHYTFRKRLSLTAYAQDQRHRMTPGSRPQIHRLLTPQPDVYTPDIIAGDAECKRLFDSAIGALWDAMTALRAHGIPDEDAAYLLPNATNLTFHQSGDLLSFVHKWRLRLCFNAQKEIFDASLDELRQVQAVHPELTAWIGPPCSFVAAAQPPALQQSVEACCPEGNKWCGVKVWLNFDAAKGTPKRPY
ncbi:MAG: FAD-dependent thymidylate synthase [Candidatus Thermoplasmatota archaeon]